MTLLLDENLSPALVRLLQHVWPAQHVSHVGLSKASDSQVWEYAVEHGFVIVSRDSDFHQRCLLSDRSPKVIWVRRGNCSTHAVASALLEARSTIDAFFSDPVTTFLVVD